MVLLALISCQESQKEINGFGGFDIGSDLSSHEKFAALRNTMPDEYYCNSIKLSEAIGEVSNLSITTENGKSFTFVKEHKILASESGFDGFYMALLERKI